MRSSTVTNKSASRSARLHFQTLLFSSNMQRGFQASQSVPARPAWTRFKLSGLKGGCVFRNDCSYFHSGTFWVLATLLQSQFLALGSLIPSPSFC